VGKKTLLIVNDTDRIREETYRLWVMEGRPDLPRRAFVERAVRILAERGQLQKPDEPRLPLERTRRRA
jgi:hypothetical protein